MQSPEQARIGSTRREHRVGRRLTAIMRYRRRAPALTNAGRRHPRIRPHRHVRAPPPPCQARHGAMRLARIGTTRRRHGRSCRPGQGSTRAPYADHLPCGVRAQPGMSPVPRVRRAAALAGRSGSGRHELIHRLCAHAQRRPVSRTRASLHPPAASWNRLARHSAMRHNTTFAPPRSIAALSGSIIRRQCVRHHNPLRRRATSRSIAAEVPARRKQHLQGCDQLSSAPPRRPERSHPRGANGRVAAPQPRPTDGSDTFSRRTHS